MFGCLGNYIYLCSVKMYVLAIRVIFPRGSKTEPTLLQKKEQSVAIGQESRLYR